MTATGWPHVYEVLILIEHPFIVDIIKGKIAENEEREKQFRVVSVNSETFLTFKIKRTLTDRQSQNTRMVSEMMLKDTKKLLATKLTMSDGPLNLKKNMSYEFVRMDLPEERKPYKD